MKTNIILGVSLSALLASQSLWAEESTKQSSTTISGLIEVEAGFHDDGETNTSDISLATVELGIDHQLNDNVSGSLLFLYEEGENDDQIAVDEAVISVQLNEQIGLEVGRMYVPFGQFESFMVSDPLTLEVAETQEEAILVRWEKEALSAAAYVFKDDEDASDKIDDYGMNLAYDSEKLSASVAYISDVNDKSDAEHSASGVTMIASARFEPVIVIAEHVSVDTLADGSKPKATNLEVGFDLGHDKTLALAHQTTDEAAGLDLPEKATSVSFSMPVYKGANFAAEYMKHDRYEGGNDDRLTLQLAYEF